MKREKNKKMYRVEKYIELVMRSTYCYKTSVWTDFRVRVSGQK